jgi:pimeloyl-ACP methyl ester carboxylesterase
MWIGPRIFSISRNRTDETQLLRVARNRGAAQGLHQEGHRPCGAAGNLTEPVTERWLTVAGLELCVEDRGEGPAILLAHGMWCDAGMFVDLAADLARDHRVIIPDLRGHGRSTVPDDQWTIAALADDLASILDGLRIPRITLVGFSMGGMAAVDFALRFGSRLRALALLGTSAAAEELVRGAEIRALARVIQLTGQSKLLAREASRATFSAAFRKAHPAAVTRSESAIRAMSDRALIHALRAVASRKPLLDRLGEIQVPCLVVTGGADRVLKPRWSQAMHRRLRRSRLVSFPGVGHAVSTERPAEVAALLRGLETGSLPRDP